MRNWAGNVEFGAARVVAPTSVAELQEVVASSGLVRAVGTGHSFSRVADTSGTLVSTLELDLPLEVLGDDRLVVVPGGATYARLTAALHEKGWALHNLGSLPHISVAGACATGTHG
ncbi:MAG TPA: FAD-binding protein, partial [Ornithinibacter sp.]|nr:FAD-binding protein [Ornithinibacter sp.]